MKSQNYQNLQNTFSCKESRQLAPFLSILKDAKSHLTSFGHTKVATASGCEPLLDQKMKVL